jgi:hypothetical protein
MQIYNQSTLRYSGFQHSPGFMLSKKEQEVSDHQTARTCDYCGLSTALRSHRRNFFEHLRTRFSGKVPFRCTHCKHRFWLTIDPRDI